MSYMTNSLKMKKVQNEKKVHLRSYLLIFLLKNNIFTNII